MLSRAEIVEILTNITTEDNKERIEELIGKIDKVSDEELEKILKERKIKSARDVRKVVEGKEKKPRMARHKFENLNDVVSFGITDETLHIHLIPKDASHMLTREGRKEAQIALIDAMEKIKAKLAGDKKYARIKHVYAVSPIMTGIVSRWFKELGFDVKTLPMEQAKEDKELSKFTGRFDGAQKLGRANLPKDELMTEEWEHRKDEVKSKLSPSKEGGIIETLQTMTNTDQEIVQASDKIVERTPETRESRTEVIE
ncbi:MAG: hypothetical protein IKK84_04520 [Clostridia bacterium]|nr:hypothetical protein [Clostridia bacterium]